MPARLVIPALLAALLPCQQQSDPAPLPDGAPPAMAHIDRDDLREHATFLASDELGGRYTGSSGQQRAGEYIAGHFEKLGLEPLGDRRSFFQEWPVERTWLDEKTTALTFGGESFGRGFAVVPTGDNEQVRLSGRFVYCGDGSPDEVPPGLRGRIPVVYLAAPKPGAPRGFMVAQRSLQRAAAVAREVGNEGGRVVLFCLLDDDSPLANYFNYGALLPDKPLLKFGAHAGRRLPDFRVPALFLSSALSRRLFEHMGVALGDDGAPSRLQGDGKASGKLSLRVRHDPRSKATNVVAVLRGTDLKRDAVVFSAHMDHMGTRLDGDPFNGADDNASGTAGLLEIAEAFAKGERPRRSVVFLSVSGEELGLWGSEWFAEHPTWPASRIVADINTDMIGRNTDLAGEGAVSVTPSHEHPEYSTLVRAAAGFASRLGLKLTSGDTYYRRSDHYNFIKKGIPAVFFCDGEHADYHKVTDHADKLDYAKAEAVARLAYWTGFDLANRPDRPQKLGSQPDW